MRTRSHAWRWLTTHVIDIPKGAAGSSTLFVILLAYLAIDEGLSHPVSWLFLGLAALLAPVAWLCWRWFLDAAGQEGRPPLPPLDENVITDAHGHVNVSDPEDGTSPGGSGSDV